MQLEYDFDTLALPKAMPPMSPAYSTTESHTRKRVKINGKFKWMAPTYVQIQNHKVPGTKTPLSVKSGT